MSVLYSSYTGTWKLTDFGSALLDIPENGQTIKHRLGTAIYRSPELAADQPTVSKMVDIWALGCIIYELACRRKAFEAEWDVFEYSMTKTLPETRLNWPKTFISHFTSTLQELLSPDWAQRPPAVDIRKISCSYCQLLQSGVSKFLMEGTAPFPSYAQWKSLILSNPSRLRLAHDLIDAYETIGESGKSLGVWKDLAEERWSDMSRRLELAQLEGHGDLRSTDSPIPSINLGTSTVPLEPVRTSTVLLEPVRTSVELELLESVSGDSDVEVTR
jgi:serine/threonine protein kinase